jgi:hypothetical protein
MYRHQYCGRSDHGDRREVLLRIVGQLCIDARVDDVAGRNEQQRITIRRGLGGGGRANRAAGAAAIIDHDRLAQTFVELLSDHPADDVGAAAGRVRHDESDWSGRKGLRRVRTGGQNQDAAAEKRDELSSLHSLSQGQEAALYRFKRVL